MPTPTTTFIVTSDTLDWVLGAVNPNDDLTWQAKGYTLRMTMPLQQVPAFRQALVEEVQHAMRLHGKADFFLLDFVNYVFAQTTDWDVEQVAAHVGISVEQLLGE